MSSSLSLDRALLKGLAAVFLAVAFLVACQDSPTDPPIAAPWETSIHLTPISASGAQYRCETERFSLRNPGFSRTGRFYPRFPAGAIPENGDVVEFRLREYVSGDVIVRTADCVIPASPAAVQIIKHRLGISQPDPPPVPAGAPSGGDIGIMSEEKPTELEPIDVAVCRYGGEYPYCDPPPEEEEEHDEWDEGEYCEDNPEDPACGSDECEYYGDCDPYGGGGGDDGDDGGATTAPPMDEEIPEDTIPDCSKQHNVGWAKAYCNSQPPDSAELKLIDAALDRVAATDSICNRIAKSLRTLLSKGNLRVYPIADDPSAWGRAPLNGQWVAVADTIFKDTRYHHRGPGRYSIDWLLSHEGDHHHGENHVGIGTPDLDTYHTPNSRRCSDF